MRFAVLLFSVALIHSTLAQSAAPPLTMAEAQRLAVERSRQLSAHDALVTSARELGVAAGRLPDPVLRVGIDNLPVDGADRFSLDRDFMTMRRVGVMQEVIRSDKRRLRAERFEREADRSAAEKNATLATIQRDTAIAWLERYYLERLRTAITRQAQESTREVEAAESAYRAGRSSQSDVISAQASRVMLDDRLSELDLRLRNARAALARWIGETAAGAAMSGEPALDSVPVHAHTLAEQLQQHPNITVLAHDVKLAEADVRLAEANKRSDWSWELAYQKRGPTYSNMVSFGVSIPLQWDQKNRQNRELSAKLALTERATALRDESLRQHVLEVETLLNDWENGRERLARYARELTPLARDRTLAALSAYRGGKGDLATILAARRSEIDLHAQALNIEIATARAWAQLRFLFPDDGLAAHVTHPAATVIDDRSLALPR